MKNLKSRLAIAALSILATTAIVAGISYAQDSTTDTNDTNIQKPGFGRFMRQGLKNLTEEQQAQMQERRAEMQAKREQMQAIFENKDYNGWQELMQEKVTQMQERLTQFQASINQETFDAIVQIHTLMQEGKYEEARALQEELGLGMGLGLKGFGHLGRRGPCPMFNSAE